MLNANVSFTFRFAVQKQLRRERIAERIRALQELVPSVNKVHDFYILFLLQYRYYLHLSIELAQSGKDGPFRVYSEVR
jgi:hypothetical protein